MPDPTLHLTSAGRPPARLNSNVRQPMTKEQLLVAEVGAMAFAGG